MKPGNSIKNNLRKKSQWVIEAIKEVFLRVIKPATLLMDGVSCCFLFEIFGLTSCHTNQRATLITANQHVVSMYVNANVVCFFFRFYFLSNTYAYI